MVIVAVVPAPSLTVYDTCWYWAFHDIPLVHPVKGRSHTPPPPWTTYDGAQEDDAAVLHQLKSKEYGEPGTPLRYWITWEQWPAGTFVKSMPSVGVQFGCATAQVTTREIRKIRCLFFFV